jgi:Phage portal protein
MNLFSLFRRPDPEALAQRSATLAVAEYKSAQAAADAAAKLALREVQDLARAQGVGGNGNGVTPRVYARDHPWDWTTYQGSNYRPRQLVTVDVLREFSMKYDVLRAMINHLKNEVEAVPLIISAKDKDDDSRATARRIEEVETWMDVEGGLGGFGLTRHDFEAMVIEDLHVIGPASIYLQPTRGGGIYQALPIDAATIKPRVDAFGWPGPGENWYEQYVDGILQRGFRQEEMYWRGLYPRTDSPYPDSPTEYLVLTVLAALSADTWNREWLTNGDEPGRWIALPQEMPVAEVRAYIDLFHEKYSGNTRDRQKVHFFPGGTTQPSQNSRRDMDFEAFQLTLARRCAAIMSVHLAAIGLSEGKEYAVTQAGSMDQTSTVGIQKILRYLEILYGYLLRRNGYQDLTAKFQTSKEEDAVTRADRLSKATGVPWRTPNEAREEEGLDSIGPDGDTLFVPRTYQPAELALNPPEPVMPGTAPGTESSGDQAAKQQQRAELRRWERKALKRLKASGSPFCRFESDVLPEDTLGYVEAALQLNTTAENVRFTFAQALEDLFPPTYHVSAQAYERQQIGAKWAARRVKAEREA